MPRRFPPLSGFPVCVPINSKAVEISTDRSGFSEAGGRSLEYTHGAWTRYKGETVALLLVFFIALFVIVFLFLQRFVTTDADLSNAEVGWVEPANPADLRNGIFGLLLAASTVQVRVFHTDPDAVEIIRDDGAIVR